MMFSWEYKRMGSRRSAARLLPLILVFLMGLAGCEDTDPTLIEETHYVAEEYGFDVARLFYALDLARQSGTVQGVVVERHGTVVAEAYGAETPHWSLFEAWEVTASLTSLLVGEALESGHLQSLEQTLGELLVPWNEHLDEEKASITIRHLLTMTSGISRPEGTTEEYFEWLAAEDQVAWVLDHPLSSTPGESYFLDAAAAHLLSAAVTQATGKGLVDLAREAILDPLGVPWAEWMVDSNGINYGGFGLRIRTRDMVKFARLILNGGFWNGSEIVSPSWVQESTRPHLHPYPDSPEWGFGYLWKSTICAGHPCIYANGYGGQILLAVPDLDLAVALNSVTTENQEEAAENANLAWDIVLGQIIPSVRD